MPTSRRFGVVDADAHVVETERTWECLDGSDRKFRPRLFPSPEDAETQVWVLEGKVIGFRSPTLGERELEGKSKAMGRDLQTPAAARELRDVALRLQDMDRLGIDVQVLHNTLWIARVVDRADAEVALCLAWNRWMADVWKQAKGRLRWSCVVPALTIDAAREQMRFARENGSVAVCLRPFETGRHLVDPYFYPLYEEASRLDMAVVVHIANADPQLVEQFRPRHDGMGGFAQFRVPAVVTCLSLMMSEVPKRFPALRWGFIEASAQWVPWVVNEAIRRSGTGAFPRNPLREFKIYVSAQTDDDFPFVLKYSGEDHLVIGTDYGHHDASSEVDAIAVFRENRSIGDLAKRKILDANPRALYALT